jgi:ketosteroid isomerase-like protein
MSQENVEIVRASLASFNRRDLDSLLALFADDVEYDVTEVLFTGPHRGKDEVRKLLRGLWELLEGMWMEAERIEDIGDGRVVVVVHQGGRGHASGIEVEARRGHVMTLRRGKIWRLKVYANPEKALEAAGLSE